MTTITQGDFTIDSSGSQITVGDKHGSKNQVSLSVKGKPKGEEIYVRVTVKARCGNKADCLLQAGTVLVDAECSYEGAKKIFVKLPEPSGGSEAGAEQVVTWQTDSFGIPVSGGKPLQLSLKNFVSATPPGSALITVVAEVQDDGSEFHSVGGEQKLSVEKTVSIDDAKGAVIHYFTVDPDYILDAGRTLVRVSFYATGISSAVLLRNNRPVKTWSELDPKPKGQSNGTAGITGTFEEDHPSITTVYRLQATSDSKPPLTLYRVVQVISPGWHQIALPQGYPTQLFVNDDFSGSGAKRLYGIFADSRGNGALYSSGTGVDDWQEEADEDFPAHMINSPGVAYNNRLWLIGGSTFDRNAPGKEVWCCEKHPGKKTMVWTKKEDLPQPRMGHACIVFRHRGSDGHMVKDLLILGGFNNGQYFGDVLKLGGGAWETMKQKAEPHWSSRCMLAAATFWADTARPLELLVYGGRGRDGAEQDLWSTTDGMNWDQKTVIFPSPGAPLGAALVTYGRTWSEDDGSMPAAVEETTSQRLYLAGTFKESPESPLSNRHSSFIFQWQWRNRVWEGHPVGDGWEQFEGAPFYMQSIAFNRFLFVWSLHTGIDPSAPPKLNVLVPT